MQLSQRLAVTGLAFVAAGVAIVGQETAQFLMPMFDTNDAPVASFEPADLTVFEDGKEAKVVKVEPRDQPTRVTLSLDNGRAMGESLVHLRTAAKEFVNKLPPSIEVALMTTAPQPRTAVKLTKDRGELIKGIDRVAPDSSPGRFIEGLQDAAEAWSKQPGDYTPVLVSVGSTYSAELVNKRHLDDAFARIAKARATVHVVMIKPAAAIEGDAQLEIGQRAARDTRGRFDQIGSHLQYTVLSDIAETIAKGTGRQFLITLQRPAGATGRLGALSMSPRDGLKPGRVTRIP